MEKTLRKSRDEAFRFESENSRIWGFFVAVYLSTGPENLVSYSREGILKVKIYTFHYVVNVNSR